jgi:2-polyprenyl-3-methyl-5-hydroxy-6-metoxy-1,4-benzoquinol methylase
MDKVTVDLENTSLYAESDSAAHRFKRRLTYRTVFAAIRRAVGDRRQFSLLEVGTGSGYLMHFVEKEYPGATVTGVEYDPRLVALTQSKVQRAVILQGNAEQLDLGEKKFDVIVSLQVVEHLYSPERMLEGVRALLAPGGRFILTTPNLACLSARVMKESWHGYRPDHVSLKDRAGWVALAEHHGFRTIYSGSTFFSGIPWLNRLPLGIINWALLFFVGVAPWNLGESFFGVFETSTRKTHS